MFGTLCVLAIAVAPLSDLTTIVERYKIPVEARSPKPATRHFYNHCAMSPDGSVVYLVRKEQGDIIGVELATGACDTVVGAGRKRQQVAWPFAIGCTADGTLLVSDAKSRRLAAHRPGVGLESSFLLPQPQFPPTELTLVGDQIIAGGVRFDKDTRLNAGNYLNVYTRKGEVVRSFAHTPQASLDRNLWSGVMLVMAVDHKDILHTCFGSEGDLVSYSVLGDVVGRSERIPPWFVPAPALSATNDGGLYTAPTRYWESWTRVVKLLYVGNDRLLYVSEAHDLVPGVTEEFVIAVYDTSGRLVHPGFASGYLPVARNDAGFTYFLSADGTELLKTRLKD